MLNIGLNHILVRFFGRWVPAPLILPKEPSRVSFFNLPDRLTISRKFTDLKYLLEDMPADWPVIVADTLFCQRVCLSHFETDPGEDGMRHLKRDPEGKTYAHAMFMAFEIMEGRVAGDKAHRWLGYAQGILVGQEVMSLDDAKRLNKEASQIMTAALRQDNETG